MGIVWPRVGPRTWLKLAFVSAILLLAVQSLWGWGVLDRHVLPVSETDSAWKTSDWVPEPSVTALCRQHGWAPFWQSVRGGRRKVYDLILVNNELDWLEIRLNTTFEYVDYFVIVEASESFTGLEKPLEVRDSMDSGRLAAYRSKIIYHELEYPPGFSPQRAWDREDLQRDATFTQVFPRLTGAARPAAGDALVVADVDEIPRPQALTVLRHCAFPRRLTLRSRFYYYGFQFRHGLRDWEHPQATYYAGPDGTLRPTHLRNGDGGLGPWLGLVLGPGGGPPPLLPWDEAELGNAGWHCSSCFRTMAELLRKMESFSHEWMNHPFYRDPARIADRVAKGLDIWDRESEVFEHVEGNTDVPTLVLRDRDRFRYLLDRGGEGGALFDDYDSP